MTPKVMKEESNNCHLEKLRMTRKKTSLRLRLMMEKRKISLLAKRPHKNEGNPRT